MLTPAEHERLLELLFGAASAGTSLVQAVREFRGLSDRDLASLTGMPVARFDGQAKGRLAFTSEELDQIAAALDLPADLLMD